MAWTDLADVSTGDIITATRENQHIDNEEFLKASTRLLIADTAIAATVQNVELAGLTAYEAFELEVALNYNYAATENVFLYINGDYTKTNYYSQFQQATSTTVNGARENTPAIGASTSNARSLIVVRLGNTKSDATTYACPYMVSRAAYGAPSGIIVQNRAIAYPTVGQIASLRFGTDRANGIGIGSRLRLWAR